MTLSECYSTEIASPPLSVIILTHNEEVNLPACLQSLAGLSCEVCVVDSGSTDRTVEIGEAAGARVVMHPFETHARQWQWALHELPLCGEWILALDADQRVMPGLSEEIHNVIRASQTEGSKGIDGFYIKRRQVFRGRWIRHGGYYPKYLLKLFRRGRMIVDPNELVDHHFYVAGRVAKLRNDLVEENKKEDDISFWIEKHNRYATLLASEELRQRADSRQKPLVPALLGSSDQRMLWFKQLWYHMPLYVRPLLYFAYRYFLCLGFLDGKEGFIFHFLQGFWFRLLVDIKLEELRCQPEDVK